MAGNQVFVLPGIAGTSLSYLGGKGGKTKLWYNPTKLTQLTPLAMALDTSGVSPYPLVGKTLFPDGPVDLGIYEPILTQLANDGWKPVFWGYDWRLSNNVSAAAFAKTLLSDTTGPFYVVCHSMGGLVAQLAYPLYLAAGGQAANWIRTIYLGTPHGGSYWAAAYLAGVYIPGEPLVAAAILFRLANQLTGVPGLVVSALQSALAIAITSFPSLYQLLPNASLPWQAHNPGAGFLLFNDTYKNVPGNVQQAWLTLASQVQTSLVAALKQPRPAELSIAGLGKDTLDGFKAGENPGDLTQYTSTLDGDGTVNLLNALLPDQSTVQFKTTDHTAIVNSGGPLSRLTFFLENGSSQSQILANSPGPQGPQGLPPLLVTIPGPNPFANKTGDP